MSSHPLPWLARRDTFLRGQHVLVTGAASGIGRALAEELLLRSGAHLDLVDVDAERLELVAHELREHAAQTGVRGKIVAHVSDVASGESVAALAERLRGQRVDVLVNCAGVLAVGPFTATAMADFERTVAVNFMGTVRVTHALLPHLLESPHAFVVNVASAAGLVGAPGMSAYSASKFALVGFSEALRVELAGRVGVLTVCPSLVRTNIVSAATHVASKAAESAGSRGRLAELVQALGADPAKVAAAIVRAIERRERLLLVNPDTHLLDLVRRVSPALTEALVLRGYRWLQRTGALPS